MRRFELVEGTSAKFWAAGVEGNNFVVVYGRLGTSGQRKEKAFPTEDAAQRELDKKIAEKLREGYSEVSAAGAVSAAPAAPGAKGAAAASAKLELPPRAAVKEPTGERVKAAASALAALRDARTKRSWALGRRAAVTRRALSSIAGYNPAKDAALKSAVDAVMARVVDPRKTDRLPLVRAMELLYELDAAAFVRAVRETWKGPGAAASPAAKAIAVLEKQLDELEDPELALRVGALLVDRPDRGSMSNEAGWKQRWKAVAPHLEAYLVRKGSTLKGYLRGIDTAGDTHIARRISRMQA
jgi:predicted DNA-binding WGR domain protein